MDEFNDLKLYNKLKINDLKEKALINLKNNIKRKLKKRKKNVKIKSIH